MKFCACQKSSQKVCNLGIIFANIHHFCSSFQKLVNRANSFQIRKMSPILQMKVQNFMKHNIKSLLNCVANEIVEYETENFSIILHCGTFIFVLLEKVSSQPYDRVLPLPSPSPSTLSHPSPSIFLPRRDTETGDPARLPEQVAGRW